MKPEEIERKDFVVALRGYDRDEVDNYLKEIAAELRRLVSDVPPLAAPPDTTSLYKLVGEETSRILLAAEEASKEIHKRAGREAAEVVSEARSNAEEIRRQMLETQRVLEKDLNALREARSLLATQLRDVGRRLDETVSRLEMPVEPKTRPQAARKGAESTDAVAVQEPEAPAPAVEEPAPAVEEPAARAEAAEDTSPPASAPSALEEILEEIRRDREEGRRDVAEALASVDTEGPLEPSPAPGEPPALAERSSLIGELPATAARKMKRLLQEDQNDLLDRLRTSRGKGSFETDISPAAPQESRFLEGLEATLQQAFSAAHRSTGSDSGRNPGEVVRPLISKQLVAPLRAEIARVVEAGMENGDTPSGIAERAGDVFRVWKGVRCEMLGEGLVLAAYHQGLLDAWGSKGKKRWVMSPHETNCPGVCRDNVEQGPVVPGEAFSSGHIAPPAHGGCSCGLEHV